MYSVTSSGHIFVFIEAYFQLQKSVQVALISGGQYIKVVKSVDVFSAGLIEYELENACISQFQEI